MYRSFRNDPAYLTRYHAKGAGAILSLMAIMAYASTYWRPIDLKAIAIFAPAIFILSSTNVVSVMWGFAYCLGAMAYLGWEWQALAWIPIGMIATMIVTSFLHNASHDNIKPKWLRRPVGEICGLIQLVGFADWVIVHVIHHGHADDPEKDPHPPGKLTYWQFLTSMRNSILKSLLKEYFALHGQTPENIKHIKRLGLVARVEQMAKIGFWYFALGPSTFTFLFASSVAFKMLHYAWFNWSTHRPMENGNDTINLDKHLYKFVNSFTFGLYYHRNHHLNPKLFDPRKYREPGVAAQPSSNRKAGAKGADHAA